ncbi:histone-arginine methyltransferase CARM1-like [Clavelina lepadiformis]|uniref:histone-arginine methyltransferase CARM1-like n=1 Tax=Clavelina lepadiformis TaxID=159417 RepID=UPI004043062A
MACSVISFNQVNLSYLNDPTKNSDLSGKSFLVQVRRVAEEAQVSILNDNDVYLKCTLTLESDDCKVASDRYLIHVHADSSIILKFSTPSELKRFQDCVDFRSKSPSAFDKRTEESSAVQYFQFYGYLSQQQNMMQDYIRTGTYQKAMLQNYINFRDKVVLDVGAGSGILSFFAMQAGARKVYAVEASTMAAHSKKLVSCSQYAGRIIVVPGKIEEISLPEKVDVIISEPMGYMLFNERMLETFLHAKKFLKQQNGLMFPTVGDLHIAPFTDELLYMEQFTKANFWYQQSFHGVDLSPLRDDAVEEYFKQPIVDTFDVRILMAKSTKHTINFSTANEEDLHRIEIPLHFTAHTSGTVHGFAFWFDIAFIGTISTVWLSTAPTEALTHWYQVRCLLRSPLFIKAGEVMLGKVVLRSNKRQSYDVDIEALVESTGCKSENSLDLKNPFFHYNGQPPSVPAGAHNSSPSDPYTSNVPSEPQPSSGVSGASSNYPGSISSRHSSVQESQARQVQLQHQNNYQNHEGAFNNHHNGLNAYCSTVPLISGGIPYPGPSHAKTSAGMGEAAIPQNLQRNSVHNGSNLYY